MKANTNPEQSPKTQVAQNTKTEYANLTENDRVLLKAYFSYTTTRGFREKTKNKDQATPYVQNVLWPTKNYEGELLDLNREQSLFDIDVYLSAASSTIEIPLFLNHSKDSMRNLFSQGERFNADEEQSFIKCYQVGEKSEVSVSKSFFPPSSLILDKKMFLVFSIFLPCLFIPIQK